MHMRYHLVKFVQENFELVELLVSAPLEARKMSLQQYVTKMAIGDMCGYEVNLLILSQMFKVPFLVIRSDMLWTSQNVRPIDCPIVLVQSVHGRFLGTRTKKLVYIGTVPRIKLTVKKHETQEILHSTPVRKSQGSQNHFQTLGEELFSPIVHKDKVQSVHSDHNYSLDSNTNKLGDSSEEFTDLGDKQSMSTEYPENSVVDAIRSINSEEESAALVDYPALDRTDGMDQLQSNIVDGNSEPERKKSDDGHSSGSEEIDVDNCDIDGANLSDKEEDVEKLEDSQRILPSENGELSDPDETIDPDATIDPTVNAQPKISNNLDVQEDVHDQRHGETNSENVIEDTENGSTQKRRGLGIFGLKFKRQKLSVKLQDVSVDLAMPLNKDDVLKLQKEQESEDNFIVQYCCNKCQKRTFTRAGYETHLLHAHQIRNADKYPPTLLRKTFKSPESLHVNSVSSADNEYEENIEKESDNEETGMVAVTEEPTSPNNDDIDNPNNSEIEQGEMTTEENAENKDDESSKEDVPDNPENSMNETTESAEHALMDSSQSEALMYPHFSEHPDEPTVECPECPQNFFYEGGLKLHLETHNSTRDKGTIQCPECEEKFFYQSGLDHHYKSHVRQKCRESGLYSEEEIAMNVTEPIQTEDKPTGKKCPKAGTSAKKVVAKKGRKTVNSDVETENENKSINSDSKGKKKRGRGRPRQAGKLPRSYKGKLIKKSADLNTSEDTERQQDMKEGMAALERLKQKKKDEEAAIFSSLKREYNLWSCRDVSKTDKIKETLYLKEKEKPKEDNSNQSKNKGRGLTRGSGTSSKNIKKDEEIDITKIHDKKQPDDNLKDESTKSKRNKGIQNIDKLPEVVNPEDMNLTKPNDEEREEKNKSGSNKKSKGSKASNTQDKVKPKAKIQPEKPTEDGKELRSRTINPAEPSTSKNDDECEILEAEEFTCKICGKTFKNYNHIKAHKLICMKLKKKYACSICSKGFTQKSMLQDHFDYLHTNKPKKYTCKPCNKTFEQKKVYLEHNRRLHNSSDYKYVCDTCSRGFFVKGEFTCHVLSHTDVKPFACRVCNTARFATLGRLNAHLLKCGKPLQFPCDLCGKYFSSKQSLKVHTAEAHSTGSKNKTWECPLCEDVQYSSRGGWYKHLRKMHGITRYGKKLEEAIIEEARKNDNTSSDKEQNG